MVSLSIKLYILLKIAKVGVNKRCAHVNFNRLGAKEGKALQAF